MILVGRLERPIVFTCRDAYNKPSNDRPNVRRLIKVLCDILVSVAMRILYKIVELTVFTKSFFAKRRKHSKKQKLQNKFFMNTIKIWDMAYKGQQCGGHWTFQSTAIALPAVPDNRLTIGRV